jgi:hypothetical protein
MKLTIKLLCILFLLFHNITKGQNLWVMPSGGKSIAFTKLQNGSICDNLIGYDKNTNYSQFISAALFSWRYPRFGLVFSIQNERNEHINEKQKAFENFITQRYQEWYFIEAVNNGFYKSSDFPWGHITNVKIGLMYRKSFNHFVFAPSITLGSHSFELDDGNITLKEKNTNKIYGLTYKHNNHTPYNYAPFSTTLGCTSVYRFSKRFFVNFDCSLYYFKSKLKYFEEVTDFTTLKKTTTQIFDYQRNILGATFGVGLIWEISL